MRKRLRITDAKRMVREADVEHVRIDDSRYEFHYKDEDDSSVKIKVGKQTLCLHRVGSEIETLLFFKQDARISGKAISVYGDIPIEVYTKHLEMNDEFIKLEYTVEGNEETTFFYHWEILEGSNESN